MPRPTTQSTMDRLLVQKYDKEDCLAAIHGQRVPMALGLPLVRLCVVRGIRYHPGFAEELYGLDPLFTRALNARRIMSNVVPDIQNPNELPYCIWHPQTASESTYRQLVACYPHMRYHVGRACAVAGYTSLYRELAILPDAHIAEEARECGNLDIFDHVMAEPTQYNVMNDYLRLVNLENPEKTCLNGDTAVCWSLDSKQKFTTADPYNEEEHLGFGSQGYFEDDFNITEDMSIDDFQSDKEFRFDVTSLLSMPLPLHLPTVEKDLLILMAAYYGDIDRYARLRRPERILNEIECCVHGIYHNTQFALWWSQQQPSSKYLVMAVNARLIMNNVLATITPETSPIDLPYLIWYPTIAAPSTYLELARRQPTMVPQILRSCIVANYTDLFDVLVANAVPDLAVLAEAEESSNRHYKARLDQRVLELGITPSIECYKEWKMWSTRKLITSTTSLEKRMSPQLVGTNFPSLYNGIQCDATSVELMSSLPREWIPINSSKPVFLNYTEWPL
ncbi:hypothetical protein D6D05_04783 [Aureobasidium pullulans]|nr:hypothetical protein D6D05_04783 [Aureobasidium pullulans]